MATQKAPFTTNYTTQCVDDLRKMVAVSRVMPSSCRKRLNFLILELRNATKFIVPNPASLKTLSRVSKQELDNLHLPYETMVLEILPSKAEERKTIALVIELNENNRKKYPDYVHLGDGFLVYSFILLDNQWVFLLMGAFLAKDQSNAVEFYDEEYLGAEPEVKKEYKNDPIVQMFSIDDNLVEMFRNGPEKPEAVQGILREDSYTVGGIMNLVLGFLAAVQCSNITIEKAVTAEEKLNKKRRWSQKTPFFDYYCLKIDHKQAEQAEVETTRTHKSPRMHTRRGHVRRLATGVKVWVSSCIVGSPINGVIEKDYLWL